MTKQELEYTVRKLRNSRSAAEGPTLPPRQSGLSRVPIIQNIQLLQTFKNASGTTVFVLSWTDQVGGGFSIDHYKVFLSDPSTTGKQPHVVMQTSVSPATIDSGISVGNLRVAISVQTVLSNGMCSPIDLSPTVFGATLP